MIQSTKVPAPVWGSGWAVCSIPISIGYLGLVCREFLMTLRVSNYGNFFRPLQFLPIRLLKSMNLFILFSRQESGANIFKCRNFVQLQNIPSDTLPKDVHFNTENLLNIALRLAIQTPPQHTDSLVFQARKEKRAASQGYGPVLCLSDWGQPCSAFTPKSPSERAFIACAAA